MAKPVEPPADKRKLGTGGWPSDDDDDGSDGSESGGDEAPAKKKLKVSHMTCLKCDKSSKELRASHVGRAVCEQQSSRFFAMS
jgi:hypothetical protein